MVLINLTVHVHVRPLYRYRIRYVSLLEETITQHMQWEVVISNVYVAPLVVV